MFRVGQKVVCVDDCTGRNYAPFPHDRPDLEGLRKGEVYTVRSVGVEYGVSVIRLAEIRRQYSNRLRAENVYAAARFRPVVERKTDISALQALLAPTAKKLAGVE